jgi:hypothetical protein
MTRARENRAIAAVGRPPHKLWWKPGTPGKGILYCSGVVHAWPEEEVHHHEMSNLYIERTGDQVRLLFLVRRDGKVSIFAKDAAEADELAAALSSADPRLQLIAADCSPDQLEAEQKPDEGRRAEWLMWQRRGAAFA